MLGLHAITQEPPNPSSPKGVHRHPSSHSLLPQCIPGPQHGQVHDTTALPEYLLVDGVDHVLLQQAHVLRHHQHPGVLKRHVRAAVERGVAYGSPTHTTHVC